MAGFAILGTTEPDFYRGGATGIPRNNENTVSKYRKIPKMSPFMYKPLKTSKLVNNAKNPPLNHSSEHNQSRGLYLEIAASNAKLNKAKRYSSTWRMGSSVHRLRKTDLFLCHTNCVCQLILLKRHRFRTVGDKSGVFVKIHFFV